MKYFGVIISFCFVVLINISCVRNNDVIVVIQNENEREFLKNFIIHNNYNVEIIENKTYVKMKNTTMDMWLEIANVLEAKMDIIGDNIANVSTTMTVDGGSFTRKYLIFTVENGIEIITDTSTEKRIVWDPTHPDAIKTGERQGYVEYPNIDIVTEQIDLLAANTFYEKISEYLRSNYKNIIF